MSKEVIQFLRMTPPGYHPGFGGPEFTDWMDEQMSWKTTAYIGDWSFLWDVELSGPDAEKLLKSICTNSFENFTPGKAKHAIMCNDAGQVAGEGVLMRMSDDTFRTQSASAFWAAYQAEESGLDVKWREIKTFQLQVSGPAALSICQKVTGETLDDIKFMHFREMKIAGCTVYALRQGMAGEPGFEFHGDEADIETVRAAILEAGEEFGIRRLGRRTAMINHLEAAFPTGAWHYLMAHFLPQDQGFFPFLGANFDTGGVLPVLRGSLEPEDVNEILFTPYELGWGKMVKFDHDFKGRDALEKAVNEPSRCRVTLEFNSEDVVDIYASLFQEGEHYDYLDIPTPHRWMVWADEVQKDGAKVGISSTPGYSYYFRKVLALAFLDETQAGIGNEVEIVWGAPGHPKKLIRAKVCPAPYKQDNRRAEMKTLETA
ncbi:aminomethyl transferase family protein [Maritimibacter harenae]|nr:aminomethyl transferase family protein [Maritimibacter harenae]